MKNLVLIGNYPRLVKNNVHKILKNYKITNDGIYDFSWYWFPPTWPVIWWNLCPLFKKKSHIPQYHLPPIREGSDSFIKKYYKVADYLRELQQQHNSFVKTFFKHSIYDLFYTYILSIMYMLDPPDTNGLNMLDTSVLERISPLYSVHYI